MIARLSGSVSFESEEMIVNTKTGVSYSVKSSTSTISSVKSVIKDIPNTVFFFYTSHIFSQTGEQKLIAFLTQEEKQVFSMLSTVNGVGSSTALSILGFYNAEEVKSIIMSSDSSMLSRVKGLGPKTAKKIIFELSGKIVEPSEEKSLPIIDDAVDTLCVLGMKKSDAKAKANEKYYQGVSLEELIKLCLK